MFDYESDTPIEEMPREVQDTLFESFHEEAARRAAYVNDMATQVSNYMNENIIKRSESCDNGVLIGETSAGENVWIDKDALFSTLLNFGATGMGVGNINANTGLIEFGGDDVCDVICYVLMCLCFGSDEIRAAEEVVASINDAIDVYEQTPEERRESRMVYFTRMLDFKKSVADADWPQEM